MIEPTGIIAIIFVFYMAGMLVVGFWSSKKAHTASDFFLANRSLGPWLTAISATSSSESAWAVMGTVGMAYKQGFSAWWFLPGCLLGYALNWLFVGDRLRKRALEAGSLTVPDFLESNFEDPRRLIRILSAFIIFSCMVAYVAAQFTAAGKAFDAIFGIEHSISVPMSALIVVSYTLLGGFLAVAWTDLIQGLIMVGGLVVLSLIAFGEVGGFAEIYQKTATVSPGFLSWDGGKSGSAMWGGIIGLLGIGLGYPGQPHVLTRFMAARDSKTISDGWKISLGWGFLVYSSGILLGICGKAMMPELDDPEQLFPKAAITLLPPVLSGVVLAAILAAIMSTADSQLLVAASTVVRDIYEKVFSKNVSEKQMLVLSRAVIALLGLSAMSFALTDVRVIFWFVLFAWSGLGASFGPAILFVLYWNQTTRQGVLAGMLTGFITTLVWKVSGLSEILYELPPAFFISCASIFLVSRMTQGSTPE